MKTTSEERINRKKIKQERLRIMQRIGELEEQYCYPSCSKSKCSCEISAEIRDLGDQLMALSSKTRKPVIKLETKNIKIKENKPLQPKTLKKKNMTEAERKKHLDRLKTFDIDIIEDLYSKGFTLGELAIKLEMKYSTFCNLRLKKLRERYKQVSNDKKEAKKDGSITKKEHLRLLAENTVEIRKENKEELDRLYTQNNNLLELKKDYESEIKKLRSMIDLLNYENSKIPHLEKLLAHYIETDRSKVTNE